MQKYYDRETDQQAIFEEMQQCRDLETSRLIVVTGRRRIGKTELVRRSSQASPEPFVYLFASRVSHTVLIENWLAEIRSVLHPEIEPRCDRLSQVIEFLLRLGRSRRINVVIFSRRSSRKRPFKAGKGKLGFQKRKNRPNSLSIISLKYDIMAV